MIFFLIFCFFLGCILKREIEKLHPNFFHNLKTEIEHIEQRFTVGFPTVPHRAQQENVNTNTFNATTTPEVQENPSKLESTTGLGPVSTDNTKVSRRNFFRKRRRGVNATTESENALILDDVILESLLCTNCGRYLSVLPIKIHVNEIIRCGRCCKENDGGTVSNLYESIANISLFRCVNRYEQCGKLLTVSEVAQHERECVAGNYRCPKCEKYPFHGTGYELLRHYKNKHPSSILTTNKFFVDLRPVPYRERYLHIKNNIIFFILVEVLNGDKIGKRLILSIVSLTPHKDIKQQFDLKFVGEPVTRMQTKTEICYSLETFTCDYFKVQIHSDFDIVKCKANIDIPEDTNTALEIPKLFQKPEKTPVSAAIVQTIPAGEITGVELTKEFTEEYPNYQLTPCGTALFKTNGTNRVELTCSVCMCFTGSNVFSCTNETHLLCWECRMKTCKCGVSGASSWNATVSSMNKLLLLPCRWKCGEKFRGDGLRNHEATYCTGRLVTMSTRQYLRPPVNNRSFRRGISRGGINRRMPSD